MQEYESLERRFREAATVRSIAAMLGWDQETFLPGKGAVWRGEQLAWLAGRQHRLVTGEEIGAALEVCAGKFPEEGREAANVRGWARDFRMASRIPVEYVERMARLTSEATHVWAGARKAADFSMYRPILEQLVGMAREKADLLGWEGCRYDALLDEYEPGSTAAAVEELFARLAPEIAAMVGPAVAAAAEDGGWEPSGHFPVAGQQAFNREVAAAIGFDFEAGRVDASNHPFCTGLGPGDTRLTTRYDESNFLSSLYGVLHEAGHGMYEQGLDGGQWGLPMGEACSLGIHESQSRLWENHIGGSDQFWEHWLPRAAHYFPQLLGCSPHAVAAAARRVSPGFIRVDADEVTYDLHVILRFEIERGLVGGSLAVADLPEAWNARFRELTGLAVPDDALWCLQDVHWSFGGFGYFPTYTMGNLHASQLMAAARGAMAGLDGEIAAGNYSGLRGWLREQVHMHGRRWSPEELMRRATGEEPGVAAHLAHLRTRYLR